MRRVVSDLWGVDDPPLIADGDLPPLPERLYRLATLAGRTPMSAIGESAEFWRSGGGWPSVLELTEVRLLAQQGWCVAPEEPLLAFLPTVWPPEHRAWIRNRVPWVWMCEGNPPAVVAPTAEELQREQEAQEADYAANLEGTGIPVPPVGRIWLLRSPVDGVTVAEVARIITAEAERRPAGQDIFLSKRHLVDAAREVLGRNAVSVQSWRIRHRRL